MLPRPAIEAGSYFGLTAILKIGQRSANTENLSNVDVNSHSKYVYYVWVADGFRRRRERSRRVLELRVLTKKNSNFNGDSTLA
jgi:hypothetical protein